MTAETMTKRVYPDNSVLLDTAEEYFAAIERNAPDEEIRAIVKRIPISPEKAQSLKRVFGKDFLLAEEADLSQANAAFGEGWLDE